MPDGSFLVFFFPLFGLSEMYWALRRQCFLPRALSLKDPQAWYTMREQLTSRREARRKQLRFRKDPAAYLAALEEILLKTSLPS